MLSEMGLEVGGRPADVPDMSKEEERRKETKNSVSFALGSTVIQSTNHRTARFRIRARVLLAKVFADTLLCVGGKVSRGPLATHTGFLMHKPCVRLVPSLRC